MKKILSFDESLNLSHKQTLNYYKNYVNKGLAIAFRILGLNILDIKSAKGCTLELSNGDRILDFTSGIGVLALGHNHEKIIENMILSILPISRRYSKIWTKQTTSCFGLQFFSTFT